MLKINEHKNKRDKSKCFSKGKSRVSFRGWGGNPKASQASHYNVILMKTTNY